MVPAAVLSILVRTNGTGAAIGSLRAVDAQAGKSRGTLDKLSGVLRSQNGLWQDAAGGWRNASGSMATSAERAAAGVDKLNAATSRSRESLKAVSRPAGIAALAVAAIGVASVNTAANYESSMNTLKAVSGSTGSEMRKLSKLAVQLGADTKLPGTSAQDAAEAMTELIKAGVSVKDTMTGVRSTLVLSAAAGIDNASAAKIAANAMNIFGLRGKDVKEVTDQLANTANSSSVEITDVADSMKMAGAVFNAFQAPVVGAKGALTELNVAIGLLGNAGVRGSDAGTSLKQALLQLTAPSDKSKAAMQALYAAAQKASGAEGALTAVMNGSKKERDAATAQLKKLNPELAKGGDIAYDSAGKMRSLKDIMRLVAEGTKGMTQEQKNWYVSQIFGADATRSVSILMKAQGGQWDEMQKKVTKAGSAQALADAKMKGLKGSIEALKSSLQTLAIVFGSVLLPAITPVVKAFTGLLNIMDPKVLGVMIGTIGGVAAAVWLLNAALAANPIVLVVAGLALLGAALVTAYQKIDGFRNVVDTAFGVLKSAIPTITSVASTIGSALVTAFGVAANAVRTAAGAVTTAFNTAVGAVRTGVQAVITEVGKWKVLFAVVNAVVTAIKAIWGPMFTVLAAYTKTGLDVILGVIRGVMSLVVIAFKTAWGVIKALFSGTFAILKGVVLGGGQILHGAIEIIGGILKGDFHQMWEGVKDIFRGAFTILMGFVEGFKKAFVGSISAIGEGIWNAFKSAFQSAKSLVVGFVKDIVDVINKLPFVNIHVNLGTTTTQTNAPGNTNLGGNAGRLARGGAYGATGGSGVVNRPMVMMGEEAPMHPEFVIPTNPAYRKRAQGLVAQAATAVGYAKGGILSDVTSAAGSVLSKGAGALTKALPKNPLKQPLTGLGTYVLKKAGDFIKDKASAAVNAVTGGGATGAGSIKATGGKLQLPASFNPSHHTAGFANPQHLDAIDVMAAPGTKVLAPFAGTVTRLSGSPPSRGAYEGQGGPFGWSVYLNGSGKGFYMTHFGKLLVKQGDQVDKGGVLGLVGDYPGGTPDHIHESMVQARKGGIIGARRFAKGGINARVASASSVPANVRVAIEAARKAGFRGTDLVNMIAIAGRESTYLPWKHNPVPPDDSWGLWQINVRPEANPKYKNWKLTDPFVNAKAAHELFTSNGLRPWNHEGGPLGGTNVAQARQWVLAMQGAAQTGGASTGGGGGGGGGASGGQSREQIQRRISANQDRIDRLRSQARNTPRGKKGAAQRTQIYDRVSSLLTQNRHMRETLRDTPAATGGPTILESQQAALAVQAADLQARVGGDITDPNTFANTAFARAGKGYDLANAGKADKILKGQQQAIGKRIKQLRVALKQKGHSRAARTKWQQELAQLLPQYAQLGQQRQAILHPQAPDTGGVTGDTGDPNQPLIDAINAQIAQEQINAEAMKAHTDALNAVQAEVKRQTDFAAAVSTTEAFQIKKILVDTVAGGMGALVNQRAQTPGSGPVAQY